MKGQPNNNHEPQKEVLSMMDSDITGNTNSGCQELMQTQDMPEIHDAGCACDCCCRISIANCQLIDIIPG